MSRRRVAGIGAGHYGRFHIEGWCSLPQAEVVAWCDPDAARAAAIAREFANPRTFADAAAMLDDVRPDLVDIVTPPATHLPLVMLACARGIPVVCQKPLAPSWDECVSLARIAREAGVLCLVHENFRFQRWYREMRRWVEAGRLGRLHSIAFRLRTGDGQGPHAYLDRQPYFRDMPRFVVMETAIHFIDVFRYLMGEVVAVSARLRRVNPVLRGEDAGYILFEFEGGAGGVFDANRCNDHVADHPRRTGGAMWLEGEAGVLRLDGDGRLWWKPHGRAEVEHAYDRSPDSVAAGPVAALHAHALAVLDGRTAAENAVEDYLVNVRVQEAVYAAHREGRRIELAGYAPPSGAPAPALESR